MRFWKKAAMDGAAKGAAARLSRLAALLTAPAGGEPSPGAAASGRPGRYDEIAAQLQDDAAALDSDEMTSADRLARAIGKALLDRASAQTIADLIWLVRWALVLGLFAFLFGLSTQVAAKADAGVFGYGAVYFGAGLLVSLMISLLTDAAAGAAERDFDRAKEELIALVGTTTQGYRDRLVQLRAQMEANTPGEFGRAVRAASEARFTTIAALRFFRAAPIINVEGEGYRCHIVARYLGDEARARLAGGASSFFMFLTGLLGAALGAMLLYFSLVGTVTILPAPPFVMELLAAEAARPGIVSIALTVAAALALPLLFGGFLAQAAAAASPGRVLSRNPARALANDLQVRALGAAAERQREMIERYADALLGLEARADAWGRPGGARHAADAADDIPAWRRPPEGPRFVETAFEAAPKAFLVGENDAGKRPSKARAPAPKRAVERLLKPPGA